MTLKISRILLIYSLIAFFGICFSVTVNAHGLKVFASMDGELADGYVMFAGGERAGGIAVELQDQQGKPLSTTHSDREGRFRFRLPGPGRFSVVADSGDGHVARYPLELETQSIGPNATNGTGLSSAGIDPQTLERLLARYINPLREQIAAYEAQRRWHDVLGGIGYILGLAGVAFFLLGRKGR